MKVSKNNKIKLEKGEMRVGNFFIRDEGENEHIRVTDLNSCFTIRVLKRMPLGIWLDNMMDMARADENAVNTIKTWSAVMWSLLSVVPDDDFVRELIKSTEDALNRHPEWYGYDKDANDDEAIQEVKEMKEFEDEIRNLEADGQENENPADKQAD